MTTEPISWWKAARRELTQSPYAYADAAAGATVGLCADIGLYATHGVAASLPFRLVASGVGLILGSFARPMDSEAPSLAPLGASLGALPCTIVLAGAGAVIGTRLDKIRVRLNRRNSSPPELTRA
jgi:uncharacterized membrane protein